ncbi:AMP-binding protein [Eubacteriaceae bacterium ES2]|nr:AMP-binding protein [Eubacteriaceae bacterium ES2]
MKNLDLWIGRKSNLSVLAREQLEAYQLACLKETLSRTYAASRYYQKKFSINPVNLLSSIDGLKAIPFTTENDLRAAPMDFLTISPKRVKKIVTLKTSGTTGESKRIFFSEADLQLTVDFFQNGMGIFTQAGDRVLVLLPGAVPGSIGHLLAQALKNLGAQAFVYGVVNDARAVSKLILEEKITGIVGIPRQLLAVSGQAEAAAIKTAGHLRTVLLSTDYVSPAISKRLSDSWGIEVYEHYGSTEMGYGGGVFCPAKTGYHLREADLYFEIVDPETGLVLPDGQWGELVFTTLTREAMPLIRYRTGDYGRYIPEKCPCGTKLKTMSRISGRRENFVQFGDETFLNLSDLEDLIFSQNQLLDFSVALEQGAGNETVLALKLVFVETCDNRDKVKEALQKKIAEMTAFKGRIKIDEGDLTQVDQKAMRKERIADRRNE